MKYICKRLLNDTVGEEIETSTHEDEYNKLCKFSLKSPAINIVVESDLNKIEKQWVSIARIIVRESRKALIDPTLFIATKKIMEVYVKNNPDIVKYRIVWLDQVLHEIETRKDSSFFYFLIISVFIFYINK